MEASAGLVAGSHNRNELVVIRRDGDPGVHARSNSSSRLACERASIMELIFLSL
jgi:cellulose synthase A